MVERSENPLIRKINGVLSSRQHNGPDPWVGTQLIGCVHNSWAQAGPRWYRSCFCTFWKGLFKIQTNNKYRTTNEQVCLVNVQIIERSFGLVSDGGEQTDVEASCGAFISLCHCL